MIRLRAILWGLALATVAAACGGDSTEVSAPPGAKCGPVSCSDQEYCCDSSCGLCIEQEVACTELCAE